MAFVKLFKVHRCGNTGVQVQYTGVKVQKHWRKTDEDGIKVCSGLVFGGLKPLGQKVKLLNLY